MDSSQLKTELDQNITKARPGKRKLALILLSAFFVLFSITVLIYSRSILNSATIYNGVSIDGLNVGGYTKEKLSAFLESYYSNIFEDISMTVSAPQYERDIKISELGAKIDIEAMTNMAFSTGRTGSVFERLVKIIKISGRPVTLSLSLKFDNEKFEQLLDSICKSVFQEVESPSMIIDQESVTLCTGISGMEAIRDQLKEDIIKAVQSLKPSLVHIPLKEKLPPSIDIDATLETLNQEPINAEFVKTSRTTYEIKTHQMGRRIDRASLLKAVNYMETRESKDYEEIPLPVEFTEPEITDEKLKSSLFKDTLATYSTSFSTNNENNYNRSINIGLAAQSINGTLLLPGEEFSFNKVVGPRTSERGYKTAHIFIDGQIRDGTGGGVCQVSTTLYNAALRANLEVTERHNHMFTVSYVPLGQDAAVSYGYADLVFKNTTAHPLRINAEVSKSNTLSFRIDSENDYPQLKVTLATKTIKTIPVEVKYIDDDSLPQGTVVVDENGMAGHIVDTYMKVFNGDILIKELKLHRSVYQMLQRKIRRGAAILE